VGSGAIITTAERTQIGINTTNNTGVITSHSDITDAGSGAIITFSERSAIAGGVGGVSTNHSDIIDVGSGAIITSDERTQIITTTFNNSGSVTVCSDVTSIGSGVIITVVERNQHDTNTTDATGSMTIHSDLTNAGSGVIITEAERTAIGTNGTNMINKVDLTGAIISGTLNMGDANISVNNITIKGTVTLGVVETPSVDRKIKADSGNDIVLENFSGFNRVVVEHEEGISVDGIMIMSNSTESDSISSGSLILNGGAAIAKNVHVGSVMRITHQTTVPTAPALGKGYLYVRNSILYFMSDSGVEQTVILT
jgi:hypothetical protein